MIMTTGWPSSIIEYLDLIGPLTDPQAHSEDPQDAYHLVVPTLPGFGFSTPLTSMVGLCRQCHRSGAS